MIINVKVYPKSGKQQVIQLDSTNFKIYLKSPAEDNKANLETVKLLQKYFNKRIKIKSGLTSRNKLIEVI